MNKEYFFKSKTLPYTISNYSVLAFIDNNIKFYINDSVENLIKSKTIKFLISLIFKNINNETKTFDFEIIIDKNGIFTGQSAALSYISINKKFKYEFIYSSNNDFKKTLLYIIYMSNISEFFMLSNINTNIYKNLISFLENLNVNVMHNSYKYYLY